MALLSWLHLSDLHLGVHGSRLLRPEYREAFEQDLRRLHSESGPWDVVFISGNLTLTGSAREFELLGATLGSLWDYFRSLGSEPCLLAVPGNHDIWLKPTLDKSDPLDRHRASSVRKVLRGKGKSRLEQAVREGFAPFTGWFSGWRHGHRTPGLEDFREGLLPGDFTATLVKAGQSIGVVGLNSSFRAGARGRNEDLSEVDIEQVEAALGQDVGKWASQHDAILLLTNHPPSKLSAVPLSGLGERLASAGSPLLHLCSGRGMERDQSVLGQFASWSVVLLAPSLFSQVGAENERRWGYAAGRLALRGDAGELTFFSRLASSRQEGFALGPDEQWGSNTRETIELPGPVSLLDESAGLYRLWKTGGLSAKPPSAEIRAPDLQVLEAVQPSAPLSPGVRLRRVLGTDSEQIGRLEWSPLGDALAIGFSNGYLAYWDLAESAPRWVRRAHKTGVVDLCFSPDGQSLASRAHDRVRLWRADGSRIRPREPIESVGRVVAWAPDGLLAVDSLGAGEILCWDTETWTRVHSLTSAAYVTPQVLYCLAWSGDGYVLACGGGERPSIALLMRGEGEDSFSGWTSFDSTTAVLDVAWKPFTHMLAVAYRNGRIQILDKETSHFVAVLEGHTDAVTGVSFSYDGRLLASRSLDGSLRLWRTDTWELVAQLEEPTLLISHGGLAFSPTQPILASQTRGGQAVRLWDIDIDILLTKQPAPVTVHEVSAKVVLVGEGGVGKSCLAVRMVKDAYEELGPTHGMKFWTMPVEPPAQEEAASRARRELILWDLGGQSEYQLVHQLFLRDSTVALMVMQPRHGERGLEEIEGWDKRLLAQSRDRRIRKILVGAQVDNDLSPVNRPALEAMVKRLGFEQYVLTSAKTGQGISELRAALRQAIPWESIEPISRPELFQRIRQFIQRLRDARRVVLPFLELEAEMRRELGKDFDPDALRIVVAHLNRQGLAADSRMADGTRVLILEVEQIERYAGSLIVAARDNTQGVPAIDVARVMSPAMRFPRIGGEERLPRDQELPVLDCVIEMLIQHGICLRHEGLLVFPSLFQQLLPAEPGTDFSHSVSLYYDFSGPIDNIYASLVATLAISRRFGALRLWSHRAEFGRAGEETSGIRWVPREQGARGVAKLDVYFDKAPPPTRALFVSLIEEHLREHGVHLQERLAITCACGTSFPETVVQDRLLGGKPDIGCPSCDRRTPLTPGAQQSRDRAPELVREILALRTDIRETRSQIVSEVKVSMDKEKSVSPSGSTPIRILHLSDLHVEAGDDPLSLLQPLAADLLDDREGLGVERLDYLVLSGDISQRASPEEFDKARQFISRLIEQFGLTAQRCIIVPGNHDLDWNAPVYTWKQKRYVDTGRLEAGSFQPQGDGFLIRENAKYPERFRNFSEHFYHPLMQKPYPLAPEDQCITSFFAESRLQFLAMNSAWRIDEFFPERSGIHEGALSKGLVAAEEELSQVRKRGELGAGERVLKLAVCHHPITGNEKMQEDAFMERLQQLGVRLCLHGHVHEDRSELLNHHDPRRGVHVIGAGSFGARARERPESMPRLYNLLEVQRDFSRLRVHTRSRPKEGGRWEGWARWPSEQPYEKRTYHDVTLR